MYSVHMTTDSKSLPRKLAVYPAVLLTLPAFVAIWGGWVGLGEMTGFGPINPLPGIADDFTVNTAITLPIGLEVYAAYALYVALGAFSAKVRRMAGWSALAALVLGMFGQACYHVLESQGIKEAAPPLVIFVSCLPILVLGAGSYLAHLVREDNEERASQEAPAPALPVVIQEAPAPVVIQEAPRQIFKTPSREDMSWAKEEISREEPSYEETVTETKTTTRRVSGGDLSELASRMREGVASGATPLTISAAKIYLGVGHAKAKEVVTLLGETA